MSKVRIKLQSVNINSLNEVIESIKSLASKAGVIVHGPIPLPTKRLRIKTRKSPCGNGTETYDGFEMRIHKRLIEMPSNDKIIHSIMKIKVPLSVQIKISLVE
ncbi:MAG: 30S ribosomal protein S10 [Candidatus Pacearchaeota archaeon]